MDENPAMVELTGMHQLQYALCIFISITINICVY